MFKIETRGRKPKNSFDGMRYEPAKEDRDRVRLRIRRQPKTGTPRRIQDSQTRAAATRAVLALLLAAVLVVLVVVVLVLLLVPAIELSRELE